MKTTKEKQAAQWPEVEFAKRVLKYLHDKNKGFCFLGNGELVSREDCEKIINPTDKGCIVGGCMLRKPYK